MPRRSARAIRSVAGGAPLPCAVCEGAEHTYVLEMWPPSWRATCATCGLVTRCGPAPPAKPKPKRSPPLEPEPDNGWPPFWY